jgi:hypothetical protein
VTDKERAKPLAVGAGWTPSTSPLGPLARKLAFDSDPRRGTIVGIASATSREGTLSVVSELAMSLSYVVPGDRPVLVVLCQDIGSPASRVSPSRETDLIPLVLEPTLHCVSLGSLRGDEVAVNSSPVGERFARLRQQYGFVVMDLPALLEEPVAADIAQLVDHLYLVVGAGTAPARLVQEAIDRVGRSRVDGVILNGEQRSMPGWLSRLVS